MTRPDSADLLDHLRQPSGSAGQGPDDVGIAERVVHEVFRLIRSGVLRPGQKLPAERELAESMGVGRPSLREALRALQLLGVLDIRHREGVFVSALEPANLLDPLQFFLSLDVQSLDALFESRVVVEAGIAELAARKISEHQLRALRELHARGAGALADSAEFQAVDEEFHQHIVEATGNPFLERIAQSYRELGRASRQITSRLPSVLRQSHRDHGEIHEALERRDPAGARAAMEKHLRNVQTAYHLSKVDLSPRQDGDA